MQEEMESKLLQDASALQIVPGRTFEVLQQVCVAVKLDPWKLDNEQANPKSRFCGDTPPLAGDVAGRIRRTKTDGPMTISW
jgi:hypothetical protein